MNYSRITSEAGMLMKKPPVMISPPAGCRENVRTPPIWDWRWRPWRNFSWKMAIRIRVYASGTIYRRRMGAGGQVGPPHPSWARPHPRPRPHGVWAPGASPPGGLRTPEASWCYMFGGKDFPRFWRYFPCRIFWNKKQQETRNWHSGILLIG